MTPDHYHDVNGRVAARLERAMRVREMSAPQLAKRCGLHENTVYRVIEGKDTRLSTLVTIARTLHIDLASLFSTMY